jgi:hypothetical protein
MKYLSPQIAQMNADKKATKPYRLLDVLRGSSESALICDICGQIGQRPALTDCRGVREPGLMRLAVVLFTFFMMWILGCNDQPTTVSAPPTAVIQPSAASTDGNRNTSILVPPPKGANLKPGARTVVLEKAGDRSYDKTFDDLRFDIDVGEPFKRDMLPESIEKMVNQKMRIRGFILPTAQSRGLTVFVLVRDNQQCCFGPGAALYDCILVEMQPGKTTEFSIRPVTVEGTFDINEVRGPDGMHLAIYRIVAESVK